MKLSIDIIMFQTYIFDDHYHKYFGCLTIAVLRIHRRSWQVEITSTLKLQVDKDVEL